VSELWSRTIETFDVFLRSWSLCSAVLLLLLLLLLLQESKGHCLGV
jgi:hypothetical protein